MCPTKMSDLRYLSSCSCDVCVCVKIKSPNSPIFGVYGGPNVQSTQIKHNSTVMDICDENLGQYN